MAYLSQILLFVSLISLVVSLKGDADVDAIARRLPASPSNFDSTSAVESSITDIFPTSTPTINTILRFHRFFNSTSADSGLNGTGYPPSSYFNGTTLLTVGTTPTSTNIVTSPSLTTPNVSTGTQFYSNDSMTNQTSLNTATTTVTLSSSTTAIATMTKMTTRSTSLATTSISSLTTLTTSTALASSLSTSLSPSGTVVPSICVQGTFICNSATTYSQCVLNTFGSGTYVFMGSVATGMQCIKGTIERQNAGPCTLNGSLQCNGEFAFYICDQGGLIDMGPVAPGTTCQNGTITAL